MTEEIRPVAPVTDRDRRQAQRREAERRAASDSRALVPSAPAPSTESAIPAETAPSLDPAAAVSVQLMGQTGQRKGLKGGPPVLGAARASYLGAEYSGEKDRRPPAGVIRKTDV